MPLLSRLMASAWRKEPSGSPDLTCRQKAHETPRLRAARCGVCDTYAAISSYSNRQLPCSSPVYRISMPETRCAAIDLAFSVVPICTRWGNDGDLGCAVVGGKSYGFHRFLHEAIFYNLTIWNTVSCDFFRSSWYNASNIWFLNELSTTDVIRCASG